MGEIQGRYNPEFDLATSNILDFLDNAKTKSNDLSLINKINTCKKEVDNFLEGNPAYKELYISSPELFTQLTTIVENLYEKDSSADKVAGDLIDRLKLQMQSNNYDREFNK